MPFRGEVHTSPAISGIPMAVIRCSWHQDAELRTDAGEAVLIVEEDTSCVLSSTCNWLDCGENHDVLTQIAMRIELAAGAAKLGNASFELGCLGKV
jgi:hypothetical protein